MKKNKLYQVRYERGAGYSSKQVGYKMRLVARRSAVRIVSYLLRRGIDAFMTPVMIHR